MTIEYRQDVSESLGFSRYCGSRTLAIPVAMCFVLGAGTALAKGDDESPGDRFCSATASALFKACRKEFGVGVKNYSGILTLTPNSADVKHVGERRKGSA
jgi:hypothetical protein